MEGLIHLDIQKLKYMLKKLLRGLQLSIRKYIFL